MVTSEAQCLGHVCDLLAASGFVGRVWANGSKHEKGRAAGRPPVTYSAVCRAPTHSSTHLPGPSVLLILASLPESAATFQPQSKCPNDFSGLGRFAVTHRAAWFPRPCSR